MINPTDPNRYRWFRIPSEDPDPNELAGNIQWSRLLTPYEMALADPSSFEFCVEHIGRSLYDAILILKARRDGRTRKIHPLFRRLSLIGANKEIKIELGSDKIYAKDISPSPKHQDIELISINDLIDLNKPDDEEAGQKKVINILINKLAPYRD